MSGNDILDVFLCQGKVDPAILQRRQEKGKDNSEHAMTPEKIARLEEGMKHPDEKDLFNVQKVFSAIVKKLNRKENKNKWIKPAKPEWFILFPFPELDWLYMTKQDIILGVYWE